MHVLFFVMIKQNWSEVSVAIIAIIAGIAIILLVLWEGFETVVLPRRVTRRFRLTRFFYRNSWRPWVKLVTHLLPARQRETWLSCFGPLSLLLLLCFWAFGLICGFALIHWALGSAVLTMNGTSGFLTDLYLSGTTFFTLGLGDVLPRTSLARLLVVVESGMGFAFLALIIGYLPALNQSFARREVSISLLDARAGSPPPPRKCSAGTATKGGKRRFANSCSNGNAGRRSSSKGTSPIRSSPISVPSTTTSHG